MESRLKPRKFTGVQRCEDGKSVLKVLLGFTIHDVFYRLSHPHLEGGNAQ